MYYPLIECVANVSEGRRSEILAVLVQAIESVAGVQLLHQDAGAGANRTVFTFAGPPEAVWESAFQLFKSASTLIDMQQHTGTHPRMGVVDVCPFVPVRDCTLEDCVLLARRLGERVWTELNIPVYLYEAAATAPYRRNLAAVRKGEYEGLFEKMQLPEWQVDFGTVHWNPRSGTTIIGARPFLIAWNINLSTADQSIARELATRLRESGRYVKDENGNKTRLPGLFSGLKAIGWYIEEYGRCQVSTNVVDPERVNLLEVYQVCCQLAKELGTHVTGSELIGLIPAKYLLVAANGELTGPAAYDQAVINLGLADLEPFEWKERVLEEVLKEN
mgnify:CR=1 FL=1